MIKTKWGISIRCQTMMSTVCSARGKVTECSKIVCKFFYNLGQNIYRLSNFLAQLVFTASETELDYCHQKVNVRVASRVAKRLMTYDLSKLGNFWKISEMLGFDGEYPAVLPKVKFWRFLAKKMRKIRCRTFHRKSYFT